MFSPEHNLLGLELATHGFAGRQFAVAALARDARRAGVPDVLTEVLASDTEPEPARLRAFGRIMAMLGGRHAEPTAPPTPTVDDAAATRAA